MLKSWGVHKILTCICETADGDMLLNFISSFDQIRERSLFVKFRLMILVPEPFKSLRLLVEADFIILGDDKLDATVFVNWLRYEFDCEYTRVCVAGTLVTWVVSGLVVVMIFPPERPVRLITCTGEFDLINWLTRLACVVCVLSREAIIIFWATGEPDFELRETAPLCGNFIIPGWPPIRFTVMIFRLAGNCMDWGPSCRDCKVDPPAANFKTFCGTLMILGPGCCIATRFVEVLPCVICKK